jgi:hypothetical protein
MADASSTILLTFGCLAAFGYEFVGQRPPRLYISPDAPLRPFQAAFQGGDPQFIVLDSQHHLVPCVNAHGFAKSSWDYDASVFVNPESGFGIHGISPRM